MIEKVKQTIIKHGLLTETGTSVVVGLSGGPDSLCLLKVLSELKEDFGIDRIFAVHINHMYRGEPAFEDEFFCRDFCLDNGIEFRAYRFDVEKIAGETGESTEEAGRRLRYGSFREVAAEIRAESRNTEGEEKSVKIAVAHNKEDNAETLIMRMARGTGTEGLCGIDYCREDIIRPLLDIGRKEIEAYCEKKGLEPRIDGTNLEPIYTRNKVRLEVIPYINSTLGCDIVETLNRLSASASDDREFFAAAVSEAERQCRKGDGSYGLAELKTLMPAVRKRLIVKAFAEAGLRQDIGAAHLEAAENLIFSEKTTGDISFPKGFSFKKRYDLIKICGIGAGEKNRTNGGAGENTGENKTEDEYKLKITVISAEEEVRKLTSLKKDKREKDFWVFDKNRVYESGKPVLRRRKSGDTISPLGFNGTKKLKNYFIDRKTDRDLRDTIPLVAVGSSVIWIPGIEVNQKYIADENSTAVVIIELEKTEQKQK